MQLVAGSRRGKRGEGGGGGVGGGQVCMFRHAERFHCKEPQGGLAVKHDAGIKHMQEMSAAT